jgi:hypothetical protein
MSRRAISWCMLLLSAGWVACSKQYEGEQRFPISGQVTVDGQPLEMGVIAFVPQGGGDGPGRVAGSPIRDGRYSVPEEKGPTAATYKVQIHWNKRTGKKIPNPFDRQELIDELTEGLPAKYHQQSELTAEVSADKTTFDFELSTK